MKNLMEKVISEMANYDPKEEFDRYTDKIDSSPQIQKMSDKEYNDFIESEKLKKHLKLDYKTKKNMGKATATLTIRDQIEVSKKIEQLLMEYNLPLIRLLGKLLAEYIQKYARDSKDYDDELYIEILDSNILSKESIEEIELMQRSLITKSSKVTPNLSAQDIKVKSQQNLYKLLFSERYDVLDAPMQLGRVFLSYLDHSTTRRTLIDRYLLYRLINLVYGGLTDEEINNK